MLNGIVATVAACVFLSFALLASVQVIAIPMGCASSVEVPASPVGPLHGPRVCQATARGSSVPVWEVSQGCIDEPLLEVHNGCMYEFTGWPSMVLPLDDVTFDSKPEDWQGFDEFLDACPAWNEGDASVFHRANMVSLVQRHQGSDRLHFIHAAIVLQHYLLSLSQRDVGMIDMARMIQEFFPPTYLKERIFRNRLGNSRAMLKEILEPGSLWRLTSCRNFGKQLRTYGPGLVCDFSVYEDFHGAQEKFSFDGVPQGANLGDNTMVLIGAREDSTGKSWFLLQNWWKHMQFVEVSMQYFRCCGPRTYFVTTPQTKVPTQFATHDLLFAECRPETPDSSLEASREYQESPRVERYRSNSE